MAERNNDVEGTVELGRGQAREQERSRHTEREDSDRRRRRSPPPPDSPSPASRRRAGVGQPKRGGKVARCRKALAWHRGQRRFDRKLEVQGDLRALLANR